MCGVDGEHWHGEAWLATLKRAEQIEQAATKLMDKLCAIPADTRIDARLVAVSEVCELSAALQSGIAQPLSTEAT